MKDLVERARSMAVAYPEDIFIPLEGDPIKHTGHYDTRAKRNLITRASAGMGRHVAKLMNEFADEIERLTEQAQNNDAWDLHSRIAELEAEVKRLQEYRTAAATLQKHVVKLDAELKAARDDCTTFLRERDEARERIAALEQERKLLLRYWRTSEILLAIPDENIEEQAFNDFQFAQAKLAGHDGVEDETP